MSPPDMDSPALIERVFFARFFHALLLAPCPTLGKGVTRGERRPNPPLA
jgi:hypothetical protein